MFLHSSRPIVSYTGTVGLHARGIINLVKVLHGRSRSDPDQDDVAATLKQSTATCISQGQPPNKANVENNHPRSIRADVVPSNRVNIKALFQDDNTNIISSNHKSHSAWYSRKIPASKHFKQLAISTSLHRDRRKLVLMKTSQPNQLAESITSIDCSLSQCITQLQDISNCENLHKLLKHTLQLKRQFASQQFLHNLHLLEAECCFRVKRWSLSELLLAMDIYFMYNLKPYRFYAMALSWLEMTLPKMEIAACDVTQLLFYCTVYRVLAIGLSRHLEEEIAKNIDNYDADMLGVIAMAFFTTNTCVLNQTLLEGFAERLVNPLSDMHPMFIGDYLKVLRHAQYTDVDFLNKFGERMSDHLKTSSMKCDDYASLQLFKTYTSLKFYHASYIATFLSAWENDAVMVSRTRFKDLVDIIWGCAVFSIDAPSTITNQLYDLSEGQYTRFADLYPEKFVEGLMSLTMIGKPPFAAISHALHKLPNSGKHKAKGEIQEQRYQIQLLDESMRILYKHQYSGSTLPKGWRLQFPDYRIVLERQIRYRVGLIDVAHTLNTLVNPHCVQIGTPLLSTNIPDILIHLDKMGQPESLPANIYTMPWHLIQQCFSGTKSVRAVEMDPLNIDRWDTSTLDNSVFASCVSQANMNASDCTIYEAVNSSEVDHRKLAIKVFSSKQYLRDSDRLTGMNLFNIKLLNNIGYTVITVNPSIAGEFQGKTLSEKEDYVKREILDKFSVKY